MLDMYKYPSIRQWSFLAAAAAAAFYRRTFLTAAESVAVGLEGQLVMLDRYNHLWEAKQDHSSGQWVLSPEPLAKLGPGRPLGYHFDHDGNLIVCDSLKVRGVQG
jgi:hypothetical protein